MKQKLAPFFHKMRTDLRYRLTTALIVCVLPVGVVSCLLFGMLWNRSERELHAADQARLDLVMSHWERDCGTVDRAMDYFFAQHLPELNYDSLVWSDVTRFRLFSELENILPEAGHDGLVALLDIPAGKALAQARGSGADAAATDRRVRELARRLEEGEALPNHTWQDIEGQHFFIKRYDQRNGIVVFALDVGGAVQERLAPFCTEGTTLYAADGDKVLELTGDGPVETGLDWAGCTAPGWGRTVLSWSSGTFPIAVSVVKHSGVLERQPWELWALLLVVLASLCAALLYLPHLIRLEVLDPTRKLQGAMYQLQSGNLDYRLEDTYYRNSEVMQYLFDTFDEMADEIQMSKEKDKKVHRAEMDNLRLQVNPHMLLNSLSTIYSLAQMQKCEAIQEYSLRLVDYFRYALRRSDDLVAVSQELAFIESYVEIQKIRYPGLFSFGDAVSEDCRKAKIPPLLIQNFVENAVKYTIKPGKTTQIMLQIERQGDRLRIVVSDTGPGISAEALGSLSRGEPFVDSLGQKHIGVWNCRRRMEAFYHEPARIGIASGPDGTQVTLDVPYWTEVRQ